MVKFSTVSINTYNYVLVMLELSQFLGINGAELMTHIYDFDFSLCLEVITNCRKFKDGECWVPMEIKDFITNFMKFGQIL